MNAYEITCILRPDLDEEHTRALAQQVVARVESAGGEVVAHYPWSPARRRMAYSIRDFGDGFYFTATFNIDPQALTEIERTLRLNDRILRFLIVQASDQMIKQAQQRMQQAEAAAKAPPTGSAAPPQAAREAAPVPAAATSSSAEAIPAPEPAAPATAEAPVAEDVPAPPEGTDTAQAPVAEEIPVAEDLSAGNAASEETPAEPVASAPAPSTTEE